MRERRYLYLDFMRIFAAYGIVVLHVMANAFGRGMSGTAGASDWYWMNGYNCVVRCCVPIFVMISGALFLDLSKPFSVSKLYRHNISRLVAAFLFWSLFYAGCYTWYFHFDAKYFWTTFLTGYAHLWFVPMLVGLYVITPFLRKIVESGFLTGYFLALSLIFTFLLPEMLRVIASPAADKAYSNMNFYFTLGYVPYFVAGAYFANRELDRRYDAAIFAFGVAALTACGILTAATSSRNSVCSTFFQSFHPCILLGSIALFVFGKRIFSRVRPPEKMRDLIVKISSCSFGVYLIHPLVINVFHRVSGFNAASFPAFWWIPVFSLAIFALSACLTAGIAKMPYVRKIV